MASADTCAAKRPGSPGGLRCFAVVLVLATLPFYVLGPVLGSLSSVTVSDVPGAALMFVVPMVAALAAARCGTGPIAFLHSMRQPVPLTWWWVVACGALPAVVAIASGGPLGSGLTAAQLAGLTAVFVTSALAEEIGWTGYVQPRLLPVLGELGSGLVIGAVWALWHIVPWVQRGDGASTVTAYVLFTVAFRVVLVRLSVAAPRGGLWLASVCHASLNAAWAASPGGGADYSPWTAAVLAFLLAALLVVHREVMAHRLPRAR